MSKPQVLTSSCFNIADNVCVLIECFDIEENTSEDGFNTQVTIQGNLSEASYDSNPFTRIIYEFKEIQKVAKELKMEQIANEKTKAKKDDSEEILLAVKILTEIEKNESATVKTLAESFNVPLHRIYKILFLMSKFGWILSDDPEELIEIDLEGDRVLSILKKVIR